MKLQSKEYVGKRKVYDLEIEDNHNYVSNDIVVHNCHSYRIANFLYKNIKTDRFLLHDSNNRMEVLNTHINTKKPTILLSPSFTEGIDLMGDLGRFQILMKVPFPYLGDNYILSKMKRVKNWYEWNTAKTIIQSSGRSVRSIDDFSWTYIIDSDFEFFYKKNNFLFPKWFKDSLVFI